MATPGRKSASQAETLGFTNEPLSPNLDISRLTASAQSPEMGESVHEPFTKHFSLQHGIVAFTDMSLIDFKARCFGILSCMCRS